MCSSISVLLKVVSFLDLGSTCFVRAGFCSSCITQMCESCSRNRHQWQVHCHHLCRPGLLPLQGLWLLLSINILLIPKRVDLEILYCLHMLIHYHMWSSKGTWWTSFRMAFSAAGFALLLACWDLSLTCFLDFLFRACDWLFVYFVLCPDCLIHDTAAEACRSANLCWWKSWDTLVWGSVAMSRLSSQWSSLSCKSSSITLENDDVVKISWNSKFAGTKDWSIIFHFWNVLNKATNPMLWLVGFGHLGLPETIASSSSIIVWPWRIFLCFDLGFVGQAAVVEVSSYQMELPGSFHPKVGATIPTLFKGRISFV